MKININNSRLNESLNLPLVTDELLFCFRRLFFLDSLTDPFLETSPSSAPKSAPNSAPFFASSSPASPSARARDCGRRLQLTDRLDVLRDVRLFNVELCPGFHDISSASNSEARRFFVSCKELA